VSGAGGPRGHPSRANPMKEIVAYLLANPILLAPLLLLVAVIVFAILKKLLKIAVILAIAAALYVVLVEYVGKGP